MKGDCHDTGAAADDRLEGAYRYIIDQFPVSISLVRRRDWRAVRRWMSSQIAGMTGYEPWEFEQDPNLWQHIVHPDDTQRVRLALERACAGAPGRQRYRIFRKDGQVRWVTESICGQRELIGDYACVISCIGDTIPECSALPELVECQHPMEAVPAALVVRDMSGRVVWCNTACAHLYGYESPADMAGTTFDDIVPEEYRDEFYASIHRQVLSGSWSGEVTLKRKDGSAVDVGVSATLLRDVDGEPVGTLGAASDISERRAAEKALRESEESHRTLIERASDGIVVLQDGRIRLANRRFLALSGYGIGELLNMPFTARLTPEQAELLYERYRRRMAGEHVPSVYETTMTRKDGSRVELEINAGVVPFRGRPADMVLFRDVTERKRAERELHERDEQLRALVENVDAIVFKMDPQMRPVAMTGRAEAISGYTTEELMSDPHLLETEVDPGDMAAIRLDLQRAANERVSVSSDFRVFTKSGEIRWLRGRVTPQFDDQGRLQSFVGASMDITERVLSQERETRLAARMAAIAEMSEAFTSSLALEAILDAASRKTGELLQAVGLVASVDVPTGRLTELSVSRPELRYEIEVGEAVRQAGLTLRSVFGPGPAHPVRVPALRAVSPECERIASAVGLGPALIVPIYADNEPISVVIAAREESRPEFNDDDVWFLTEVASHASVALSNALRYRRQARIAETLQRSLIPGNPTVERLDIASCYHPALREAEVGGDFFDVISLPGGRVGLVVGDVAGKGLTAAVHTAEAKFMLRAFAHDAPDPGSVVTSLNRALCAYAENYTFVTLFYGLLDVDARMLHYVNAGQEIPLILSGERHLVRELTPTGTVLGIEREHTYTSLHVAIGPDDSLFIYTDGVTDARVDSERFGHERLTQTISAATPSSAQDLLDHVCGALHAFAEGGQTDDQVMVVVRVSG